MKKVRLFQFLRLTGEFKDKSALIDALKRGEITIDGRVVTVPHFQFSPKKRVVAYQGKPLGQTYFMYFILNKPEGYVCARVSEGQEPTPEDESVSEDQSVYLLLPQTAEVQNSVVCVGRLDKNTKGLLVMTNDGAFASFLTQPRSHVPKTYVATLAKPLTDMDLAKIQQGVIIQLEENGIVTPYHTKPCKATRLNPKAVLLTLDEGKKREVRRIFESLGNEVTELMRMGIGCLFLQDLQLKPGEHKVIEKQWLEERIKCTMDQAHERACSIVKEYNAAS